MKGIRFTKAERKWLVETLEQCRTTALTAMVRDTILAKLELAEMPVANKQYGVTVTDAITAFRETLGRRLIAPPFAAVGVLSQMKNRLAALGLTRGDCTTIAKVAAATWRGPVRAESLVRQADKLLAQSQQEIDWTDGAPAVTPVELSDEEL